MIHDGPNGRTGSDLGAPRARGPRPQAGVQQDRHRGRRRAHRGRGRHRRRLHAPHRRRTRLRHHVALQLRPPQGGPVRADGRRGQRRVRVPRGTQRRLARRHDRDRPPGPRDHVPAPLARPGDDHRLRLQPQRPALSGVVSGLPHAPGHPRRTEDAADRHGQRHRHAHRRQRTGHGRAGPRTALVRGGGTGRARRLPRGTGGDRTVPAPRRTAGRGPRPRRRGRDLRHGHRSPPRLVRTPVTAA